MKRIMPLISLLLVLFTWNTQAALTEKELAVEKMFEVMEMDKQLGGSLDAILPIIRNIASKLALNADESEELKEIYKSWFNNDVNHDQIILRTIRIYADKFSQQEIQEITAFYQTPVGKKFLSESPDLLKYGVQIGIEEGQAKQHLLLQRLEPFLAKHKKALEEQEKAEKEKTE